MEVVGLGVRIFLLQKNALVFLFRVLLGRGLQLLFAGTLVISFWSKEAFLLEARKSLLLLSLFPLLTFVH